MKQLRILSIIGIIIGLSLISISTVLLLIQTPKVVETIYEQEQTNGVSNTYIVEGKEIQHKDTDPKEIPLKESGWIPNWAFDLGYESLINNKDIIDTINPVLYTVNIDGEITSRGIDDERIQSLVSYCKENNIRVIPTVGSYDYDSMSNSLSSAEKRSMNISFILSEIDRYSFDGIDLDYEMIVESQKDNYITFLKDLGKHLTIRGSLLSVTVFPQWSNAEYSNHISTRNVQDYELIGGIADEVRIMAYDFTHQSSRTAGPIAPVYWIREVLDYATELIPREKIWLGIHLYSYQWIGETKTVALTHTSTLNIINNPNITSGFREDLGEGLAEFGCEGGLRCVLYYQTKEGVNQRREIAREYGIQGVSYWRLGGDLDIIQ